jgi:hypothetical protein
MLPTAQDPRQERGDPAGEHAQYAEDRLLDPVDQGQKGVHVVLRLRSTSVSCAVSEAL